jgi:hypothetical protein
METRKQTKIQAIVTILSFTVLVALASTAPRLSASSAEIQSFVGTTPNAADAEPLPPTF